MAPEGFRFCNRCEALHPATSEFFVSDKSRPLGLAYECRPCMAERKKGRDRRPERWANLSPEQRERTRARHRKWGRTHRGRATFLLKAYQRIDGCDFSAAEISTLIQEPCIYCGTTEVNRGLDRIDNSGCHTKGNVVVACGECNIMRGDRFSVKEMRVIGRAIALVRSERLRDTVSTATENEDHP